MLRQLVAGSPDPHHSPLHPSLVGCAEPGRPTCKRCGSTVEGGPERGHRDGQGVDREVRNSIVHVNGLSMMTKERGNWHPSPSPSPCFDAWSTIPDDDKQMFSTFGSSSDLRVMVSQWNDDLFEEVWFLIPKPQHLLNLHPHHEHDPWGCYDLW